MAGSNTRRPAMSATTGERVFEVLNTILLVTIGFIIAYPFWNCIILSFSSGVDAVKGPLYWLPRKFTLDNYIYILTNPRMGTAAFNSVMRTVIGTVSQLVFTGIASYGLSKRWVTGHKIYMLYFVLTMYFSGGLIPTYLLIRDVGLLDNFLVYIIPSLWSFYNAILMIAYYDSIPGELEEAATIDGANKLQVFFRIILPASMPIFATVAIFTCVSQWNSWFDTMIYTSSDKLITLQSIMARMINEAEAKQEMEKMGTGLTLMGIENAVKPITIRVATLVVTTFPIAVVYPFLQKYFVKGIMLGSVKG